MTDLEQRVAAALHTVNENPGEGATLELAEDDAARKLIAALAAQGLAITGAPDAEYGTVRDWTGEPSTPSPLPSETPRSIAPDTEGAGHPEPVERGLDEQFYQRVRHALRRMTSTTLIPAGRVTESLAVYPVELGGGRRWMAERRQPVRYAEHMVAMTTADGTAAAETALCGEHDLPLNRDSLAAQADTDVTGPWVDATGNDALACQVCGAVTADLPDSSYDAEELDPTAPWNVGGDS